MLIGEKAQGCQAMWTFLEWFEAYKYLNASWEKETEDLICVNSYSAPLSAMHICKK